MMCHNIAKGGDKGDFCLISVLPAVAKILEKLIVN